MKHFFSLRTFVLFFVCAGLIQTVRADYGESDDILPDTGHEWGVVESGDLSDLIHAATLVTAHNKSYVNLVISYIYDGKPVSQVIPSGTTVALGLNGKIDFANRAPRVYRYNELGAKIFGSSYNYPHVIPSSIHGQQYGGTCGNVLELSLTLSAIYNTPVDVRLTLRKGYNFNKKNISQIFPNLSQGYLSYIGLGSSLESLAKDPLQARHMLNLPRTFAQKRTQSAAQRVIETALETKVNALNAQGWIESSYKNDVLKALVRAAHTLREFLLTQGDTANLVEF